VVICNAVTRISFPVRQALGALRIVQIQGRALVWSWEQSPNEAPALYETVRVFLAMKMIGKMYLKWLF
jgi:hypothetical protein